MHQSTLAVARALGIELVEPKGWTCCGATRPTRPITTCSLSLPAANLVKVQDMGLDMVVNCAACYNRMKVANHEIATNPEIRESVARRWSGITTARSRCVTFWRCSWRMSGLDAIKKALNHSLDGLKVACYYGCLLVRPPEVTGFDDPENPASLDRLVTPWAARASTGRTRSNAAAVSLSLTRRTWS